MTTDPDDLSVPDVLDLKSKHMLAPNPDINEAPCGRDPEEEAYRFGFSRLSDPTDLLSSHQAVCRQACR